MDQAGVYSIEAPAVHRAEARFHVTEAAAAVPAYLIRRANRIVSLKHAAAQVKSADEVDDNGNVLYSSKVVCGTVELLHSSFFCCLI